jgi:hypothetical protein
VQFQQHQGFERSGKARPREDASAPARRRSAPAARPKRACTPVRPTRFQQRRRNRWPIPALLALAAHVALLLLLLWQFDLHRFEHPAEAEAEAEPIVVHLLDLDEQGESEAGADPDEQGRDEHEDAEAFDQPTEPSVDPVHEPPQLPPQPADPVEQPQQPGEPAPSSPDDRVADEAPTREPRRTPLYLPRYSAFRRRAAPPPRAPRATCNNDYTHCVFEDGHEHEISPSLVPSVVGSDPDGRFDALSDAEFQSFRDGRRTRPDADGTADGMPVYSNYGRFPNLYEVDLERMAASAAGAPYSCAFYPHHLNAFDEEPAALYVIIDSSGSMVDNKYTSPATRCAFRAAQSALEYGIPVGVINFSEQVYYLEESTDEQRIAEVICKDQKKNTMLPEEQLVELIVDGGRRDVFLVSDGEIANLGAALPHLESVLARNPANRGVAALLGAPGRSKPVAQDLGAIGFRVVLLRF